MRKKVIQVPLDEKLLSDLNEFSKKQRRTRSEIIREACVMYIADAEQSLHDKTYTENYRKYPENSRMGQTGLKLLTDMFPGDTW